MRYINLRFTHWRRHLHGRHGKCHATLWLVNEYFKPIL